MAVKFISEKTTYLFEVELDQKRSTKQEYQNAVQAILSRHYKPNANYEEIERSVLENFEHQFGHVIYEQDELQWCRDNDVPHRVHYDLGAMRRNSFFLEIEGNKVSMFKLTFGGNV